MGVFDAVPEQRENWFPVIANLALVMIGFVLGGQFTRRGLAGHGRAVFTISLIESATTASLVAAGLAVAGADLGVALLFGGIAAATEPAATAAVVGIAGDRVFPRSLGLEFRLVTIDD